MRLLGMMLCVLCMSLAPFTFANGDCNNSSLVTRDILLCANSSYQKIDKKLNEQYRGLVSDPKFLNKNLLRDGARAWIKYRDSYCGYIYESIIPGEEAEIERIGCLASLTASRVVEMLYLETGVISDRFYVSLSVISRISSKTRAAIFSFVESSSEPYAGAEYYKKNCELTAVIHAEEERVCRVRMKFNSM